MPENPPTHIMSAKGFTPEVFQGQAYHVYVRFPAEWDEIRFRDDQRHHRDKALEYEALKIALTEEFQYERDGYRNAKGDFIQKINTLSRKERQ
ncbi:MAG: hypothetical protein XE04_1923 [Marinimicrobia bacterium 46_43]|nr:MAG: hypothetical protein XE04_1923 [Marinimicrobia bacterium 46_43]